MIEFSNREMATLIWLGVFAVALSFDKKCRGSIGRFFISIFDPKLLKIFVVICGYIYLELVLFTKCGLWKPELIKETVYWFFGSAVVMLARATPDSRRAGFFKKSILDAMGFSIFIEFLTGFYSFPLPGELLLIPLCLALSSVSAVAARKKGQEPVMKFSNILLGFIGIFMISYCVREMISKPETFWTISTLRELAYAPLMTLGFLPIVYIWALYGEYEYFFLRIRLNCQGKPELAKKAQWIVFCYASFNLWKLMTLWKRNVAKFINLSTEEDLKNLVVLEPEPPPEMFG